MKRRLFALVLLPLTCFASRAAGAEPAGPAAAQSAASASVGADQGRAYVSVLTEPGGGPILVVRYPWKRHLRPSVEVRTLDPSEVDNLLLRPLFFLHDVMKGEITTVVYLCQARCEDVPQTAEFSRGETQFEVFGQRNLLGRPAVAVASRAKREPPTSPRETRAAFPLLDAWALDEHTLYLELPPEYFSKPTPVRVWLLRGKSIVWTETADWPGTGQ